MSKRIPDADYVPKYCRYFIAAIEIAKLLLIHARRHAKRRWRATAFRRTRNANRLPRQQQRGWRRSSRGFRSGRSGIQRT
ncbi:MAG: hypothetical protein KF805_08595 [Phycisphaeraceae bacterium]|nr:hypothetical protein [Phycisphaeraceae bacterium]